MLSRAITLPVDVERMWQALVEPSAWIGAQVEWDLVPGGRARFVGDPAGDREGRVDDVQPGRRLAFHWWPEADPADESEVACELQPDGEGTRLVVTERRLERGGGEGGAPTPGSAQASARQAVAATVAMAGTAAAVVGTAAAVVGTASAVETASASWDGWDSRLVGLWMAGSARVLARA